jgi:hypothetical protein
MSGLWRRAKPYLPWVSLTVGVLSGLLMNRSPERAWLVVGAAAGAWFLVMALAVLGTLDPERLPALHGRLVKLGLASAPLATQSLVQLALFFAFPFYARAATWTAGHALFLGALAAAGALTLWDPAFAWVFGRRPGRLALVALASFAGLACVLPVLGLANQLSLVLAALFTAAGVPLLDVLESPRGEVSDWPRRARRWLARGLVAGVVLALTWGLGGPLVPPAPLSLGGMAVGTRLGDRWVADPAERFTAPSQLTCATAIRAPRGLQDALRHEWWHDGVRVDVIDLEVRGGREEGFRTWSTKRNLGPRPGGRWRCRVVTAAGQVLGQARFEVASDP